MQGPYCAYPWGTDRSFLRRLLAHGGLPQFVALVPCGADRRKFGQADQRNRRYSPSLAGTVRFVVVPLQTAKAPWSRCTPSGKVKRLPNHSSTHVVRCPHLSRSGDAQVPVGSARGSVCFADA